MKRILLTLFIGSTFIVSSQCATSVTATDTTICLGDSVLLTATGPGSPLTTTFAAGNNHRGNMFDIVALNTVTIQSFDAHPQANTGYEIYYKVGGYAGSETNPAAWTLLGSAPSVIAQPMGTPTPIPININITISAGQTYAFYVTSTNIAVSQNYTDGTAAGSVYASDANIQFLEGAGMEYPFAAGGGIFTPRVWNGVIHYDTGTTFLWSTGDTTTQIGVSPSVQTTYYVDITSLGCPNTTDSVTIYMNPEAVVDLGMDTSICAGTMITLDAGAGMAIYDWNSGGASTQTLDANPGSVNFVEVTTIDGCTKTDTVEVFLAPAPIVYLGADTTICVGNLVTLDAGNAGAMFDWNTTDTTQTIDVGAGSYSVNVTNPQGCVDSSNIVIAESPAPIVNLGNDTTYCIYGSTVLDAGTGFASYLWSTAATTQTIVADGTTLGAGLHTFTVQVTDSLSCSSMDTLNITVDGCAGIDAGEINHMTVYPNPTSSLLNVRLDQSTSGGQLTIYSMDGLQVLSEKLTSKSQSINLESLANGSYILELKTEEYKEIIKVIKN
jgi:hypothetical protein